MSWARIEPKRSGPSPRHCHSAVSLDGKIYVFGGTNGKDKYNDLYCFDPGMFTLKRENHHFNHFNLDNILLQFTSFNQVLVHATPLRLIDNIDY